MNWRPIIFDGESIRAILAGDKTQTRRVTRKQPVLLNEQPIGGEPGDLYVCPDAFPTSKQTGYVFAECESIGIYHHMGTRAFVEKHCPYGVPGDMLWVRETWAGPKRIDDDNAKPSQIPDYATIYYRATSVPDIHQSRWRTPIHMPRKFSRISLRVTDVRVQRLHSIGRDDVIAEGVTQEAIEHQEKWFHKDDSPALAYAIRWDGINGKRAPWATNPLVWAVTFERSEA